MGGISMYVGDMRVPAAALVSTEDDIADDSCRQMSPPRAAKSMPGLPRLRFCDAMSCSEEFWDRLVIITFLMLWPPPSPFFCLGLDSPIISFQANKL